MGVQPAGIVNAEEQQNVRQNADADVHEQIHERVCCKAAAQEGKNKVADQRCTAQNRHDEVQAVPRVAVEPVGKDEQRRDEQQQIEDLPRAVEAAAQHGAHHPQDRHGPDGHQNAEMTVGRVFHQQEIKGAGYDDER